MKIAIISFLFAFLTPSTKVKLTIDETIAEDPMDFPQFYDAPFELPIAAVPSPASPIR